MGFALIFGALVGIGIAVVKITSDSKEGKTGKCRFCGAKMAGRYSIEMPVCQRCGRTQPWAFQQAEQAHQVVPAQQQPTSTAALVRRCPTCQQPLTEQAGTILHAYSKSASCEDHARIMGLPPTRGR